MIINQNVESEKSTGIYSWFTEALISDVISALSEKYDITEKNARMMIMKGGLNIYSTINPYIQNVASNTFENYKAYILPNDDGSYPEASCVIMDANTSDVLALVGGVGKKEGNRIFNRATQAKRSPGSVLKPLSVYAPSLENRIITFSSIFDDTPIKISNDLPWPKNSPNRYKGLMPVSYAIEHSTNTVAVKALNKLGIDTSFDYLTLKFKLNLDVNNDKSPSPLALGQLTYGETLLNISNAYTTFANGGYISNPKTFLYVTDNLGNKILENDDKTEKILSGNTCAIVNKLLEGVVKAGTAKSVTLKTKTSVAGKTGTSSDLKDKWFIGYTPSVVCGIWCGYDMPKPMYYSNNPSCVLFDEIMNKIYENGEREEFYMPNDIISEEFCVDSGLLPCEQCKSDLRGNRVNTGYYIRGTEPKEICNLHKNVIIDIEDGLLANTMTPAYRRRIVSLLDYHRVDEYKNVEILDSQYLIKNRLRN